MYISILGKIIICCIISTLVCASGVGITLFTQGGEIAMALYHSYVFEFNGILIVGFGYGLYWFINTRGMVLFNSVSNIIEQDDSETIGILRFFNIANNKFKQQLYGVTCAAIGGTILWNCGYPLNGFAKYFLAVSSISLFYVAGMMAPFFYSIVYMFRNLDRESDTIKLKNGTSTSFEMENIDTCLMICTTIGVCALFLSFRGTLTANYTFLGNGEVFRQLLITPIIAFLPALIFVSFYYRYVLRKLQSNDIIRSIQEIEDKYKNQENATSKKEELEINKLILDIKEKISSQYNKTPWFSLKDSPALFVVLLLIVEFIVKYDEVVKSFFLDFIR